MMIWTVIMVAATQEASNGPNNHLKASKNRVVSARMPRVWVCVIGIWPRRRRRSNPANTKEEVQDPVIRSTPTQISRSTGPKVMDQLVLIMAVLRITKASIIQLHLKSKTSTKVATTLPKKIIHGRSLKRHPNNCLKITNLRPKKHRLAWTLDTKQTNMGGLTNPKTRAHLTSTVVATATIKATWIATRTGKQDRRLDRVPSPLSSIRVILLVASRPSHSEN